MKNIFTLIISLTSIATLAQVTIGNINNASINQAGVLMDFEKSNNKGILLPSVNSTTSITEKGTIALDASTPTSAEFKLKKNSTWFNYSRNNGNATAITSFRPAINDLANSKIIIGADNSTADGALVLESTTKALVLPTVKTVDNIINPSPGMMVFVKKDTCISYTTPCTDQFLAFFNGTEWSFWTYTPTN